MHVVELEGPLDGPGVWVPSRILQGERLAACAGPLHACAHSRFVALPRWFTDTRSSALAFSPDGSVLAVGSTACSPGEQPGGEARTRSSYGGERALRTGTSLNNDLCSCLCSVLLVDVATWRPLATLPPSADVAHRLCQLAFLADGVHLVSQSFRRCLNAAALGAGALPDVTQRCEKWRLPLIGCCAVLSVFARQAVHADGGVAMYNLVTRRLAWMSNLHAALMTIDACANRLAVATCTSVALVDVGGPSGVGLGLLHGLSPAAAHFIHARGPLRQVHGAGCVALGAFLCRRTAYCNNQCTATMCRRR